MEKVLHHKVLRIIYYVLSFIILISSASSINISHIVLDIDDYIFLFILVLSYILVNKYSIKLKYTNLNFSDFIIIVLYIIFGVQITVLLLFTCYLLILSIEYKNNKNQNLLTENTVIFNTNLIILSVYLSHLTYYLIDKLYYIRNYEAVSVIVFSISFLIVNYILFCLDLSFEKSKLMLLTLQNGLYYIFLNFLLCTVIASFSLLLYNLYNYLPIVIMNVFIIFVSFSLNSLNTLKTTNNNLKAISQCTTYVISKADFKLKLHHVIQTIEGIIPFVFCGIYFFRDTYDYLYPVTYKSNFIANFDDTKFFAGDENRLYKEIIAGNVIFKESSFFKNNINIVNNTSSNIRYVLIIPIKNSNFTAGFIMLCLSRYNALKDEIELLCTLGQHLGMMNLHINTNISDNILTNRKYDGLTRYIDYNIKYKIFFTLAMIEISNYRDIIEEYNTDFYNSFKSELVKYISKYLSSLDNLLFSEKENIYIAFNLLDSRNALNKLEELETLLKAFTFKNICITTRIAYSTCEYPIEGTNSDEILAIVYRKLHAKNKNA